MACGLALKRPYDPCDYLTSEGGGAKRPRTLNAHCSPFRPTFGTVAASLPSSVASLSLSHNHQQGPFSAVQGAKLTSQQLESYLRAEVRYLRRRKLIPRRREREGPSEASSSSGACYRAPDSPNQSASDSDGETVVPKEVPQEDPFQGLYDRPQFSLRQVQMICERLLKEQELRLRYEYETVLNQRLEEQHEQYVKFTEDQIERRFENNDEISYLS